ncbi:hypothetical protein W823_23850 [Williamsia sp. D3]|nr:hypothetical protein W823_23850 [Williamsia sp. D3]
MQLSALLVPAGSKQSSQFRITEIHRQGGHVVAGLVGVVAVGVGLDRQPAKRRQDRFARASGVVEIDRVDPAL